MVFSTPKHILILRDPDDGASLALMFKSHGYIPHFQPVLKIIPQIDHFHFQAKPKTALAFTSRNAVKVFAGQSSVRDIPTFCVGEATASLALDFGFTSVYCAENSVGSLADLIVNSCAKENTIVHMRGQHVAHSLDTLLKEKGYSTEEHILYRADPFDHLNTDIEKKLRQSDFHFHAVLFFSKRGAVSFCDAVVKSRCESLFKKTTAVAISHAVAESIPSLWFKDVIHSEGVDSSTILHSLMKAV